MKASEAGIEVGTTAEFRDTDRKIAAVGGQPVLVLRVGDGYYAVSSLCTHARVLLSGGTLEGYELECPLHGARFDIRDGRVLCPPAARALKTYRVAVADGRIRILP